MPKISTEADRVLVIIELAARRTRDKHNQFASSTRGDRWKTFADEIAALVREWRKETDAATGAPRGRNDDYPRDGFINDYD